MKFMALFSAPLSQSPFSSSASGKSETTPKRTTARANKSYSEKIQSKAPVQLKPYRGTSIVVDECACDAVRAIGKQRFLVAEGNTPMLPLPTCDASICNCKYMHHDDRREYEDDRRLTATLKTDMYEDSGKENRRMKKRGRRKTDV